MTTIERNGETVPHSDYPHQGNGDLYDCPACEVIMAEAPAVLTYRTDVRWESEYADEPVTVSEDSWADYCIPDEWDEEGTTAVDKAVAVFDRIAVEPSSYPGFYPGMWYSEVDPYEHPATGVIENQTFHLRGFSEAEQRQIFDRLTSK